MQRGYGHPMSYGMGSNGKGYGPYESYDSRSSLGERDLKRSGYGYNAAEQSRFTDSFDEGYDNFGGRNKGGSSWDAPHSRPNMRTGFMNVRGRGSYSSFSGFSSSLKKPAPAGLRGRGMPAYPEGAFGGRGYGGPSTGRGRGRGQMGAFRGMPMQGANMQSRGGAMGRGTKRKMNPPADKPVEPTGKKAKVTKSTVPAKPELNEEEEEKRKVEARRDKQRRRREKNNERMAYNCSFCKYRSFDEKDIEAHLESALHKDTLDHIQKQTKFEEKVIEFLHECMVNKYKKTSLRKAQTLEAANLAQRNMMEGITDEDHMMKIETVHCSACSVYVPAVYSSVQQHFKSPEHAKSKTVFKEQVKRECILTATSILNNPVVKQRYERFVKGENPFEGEPVSEQAADENDNENEAEEAEAEAEETETQNASEQVDYAEDAAVDFTEDTANFVEDAPNDADTAELVEDAAESEEDPTDQIDFTADYVTTE